jgi:hypothetical protein
MVDGVEPVRVKWASEVEMARILAPSTWSGLLLATALLLRSLDTVAQPFEMHRPVLRIVSSSFSAAATRVGMSVAALVVTRLCLVTGIVARVSATVVLSAGPLPEVVHVT